MKIALFIPCLVNQMLPEVAVATLELLEKLGHEVICLQVKLAANRCPTQAALTKQETPP
ncbi:hypothetical protein BCS63_022875 [Vibrio cyclitrophicus]